jgi:hypothetical protein
MACKLTIWTDFEVPSTSNHQFTCDAIAKGDNALLNLGCDRYRLEMSDGSGPIVRRRKWVAALLKTGNPYTIVTL